MNIPPVSAPLVGIPVGGTAAGAARQYSTTLGAPMQSGTDSVAAFSRDGGALAAIAGGLNDVAAVTQDVVQKTLQERAETEALEAYAAAGMDLNKHLHGEGGIFSQKGINASNAVADTSAFFDKTGERYLKSLSNDAARKIFSGRFAQLRYGTQSEVAKYEGGERREAQFTANKSAMALDMQTAMSNPYSDRIFNEAWERYRQGGEKLIEMEGMGPEQAQLYRQAADSEFITRRGMKFIEGGDLQSAWKMLQDPRLLETDRATLEGNLQKKQYSQLRATAQSNPDAAKQISGSISREQQQSAGEQQSSDDAANADLDAPRLKFAFGPGTEEQAPKSLLSQAQLAVFSATEQMAEGGPNASPEGRAAPSAPAGPESLLSQMQLKTINATAEITAKKQRSLAAYDLHGREQYLASLSKLGEEADQALLPTLYQYEEVYGQEEGRQRYAAQRRNLDLGDAMRLLRDSTPEQQRELLNSMAPDPGGAGSMAETEQRSILRDAVVRDRKMRADNPAAYILLADDTVRGSYSAFKANPTPEGAEAYVRELKAARAARGMPENAPLLPKDDVTQLGAQFINSPEKKRVDLALAQREMWGKNWDAVFKQLVKDKDISLPQEVYAIGAGMDEGPARLLAEANKVPNFRENAAKTAPDAYKRINDLLPRVFKPMRQSLSRQGGTLQASMLYDQCLLLALQYEGRGHSADDSVRMAYNEIGGKRYTIQDGYRVPIGIDPVKVQYGMDVKLKELTSTPGMLRLDKPDKKWRDADGVEKLTGKGVRQNVQWVTNEDETGVYLYRGYSVVENPDGTPVELTWDELTQKDTRVRLGFGLPFDPATFPGK